MFAETCKDLRYHQNITIIYAQFFNQLIKSGKADLEQYQQIFWEFELITQGLVDIKYSL